MTKPDQALWLDVLSYLRTKHPAICRQWFDDIEPLGLKSGVFRVRVDQDVRLSYLERVCAAQFTEALRAVSGALVYVRFIAEDEQEESSTPSVVTRPVTVGAAAISGGTIGGPKPEEGTSTSGRRPGGIRHEGILISPDYTFENFIVGPENRLAHAASQAICEKPGRVYNPFFVHGGVGLGKTHLLQALCLRLMAQNERPTIYYVSCDEFMTQFMEAVQAGAMSEFRHRFRDVDVLVIDDIHFLTKRDRTQEEFFHTFNSLYQSEKQIVLSSDAPPEDIPDLEDRLISRFQSGLVVQMNAPCFETRVQIVKQKGKIRGLDLSEDVACFIANRATQNIRELEGSVTKIQMLHVTDQRPIDLELAKQALEPDAGTLRPQVTMSGIVDAVCAHYSVKLTDLQSKRRQKSIVLPRQICMYLARRFTRFSLEEIGGHFGGRDHTTVMHAVKMIDLEREENAELARVLAALEDQVRAPSGSRRLAVVG
jgi:chromosomal replication initiator protein